LRCTFLNLIHCQTWCSPLKNIKWWKCLLSVVNSRCNEENQQLAGFNFMSHFLSTKHAATTSVLSKRWTLVWLSVLSLQFDSDSFLYSLPRLRAIYSKCNREMSHYIPIHSFRFKLWKHSSCCNQDHVNKFHDLNATRN
jgi:hypothetical protein